MLLEPGLSRISSLFRLAVVVSRSECAMNGSLAIARGIAMVSCIGGGIVARHSVICIPLGMVEDKQHDSA